LFLKGDVASVQWYVAVLYLTVICSAPEQLYRRVVGEELAVR